MQRVEEQIVVEHKGKADTVLDVTKMNYDIVGELDDISLRAPKRGKDHLSEQNGRLYLKCDWL